MASTARFRWKGLALALAAVLAIAAVALVIFLRVGNAASNAAGKPNAPQTVDEVSVPVEVEPAAEGRVAAALTASSTLESEQQADVLAKTDGLVTGVQVDEGTSVTTGALLAEIDDTEKALALKEARVRRDAARVEFERARKSAAEGLISQADLDKARHALELAETDLETKTLALSYARVTAPFAGQIVDRAIVAGRHVKPGDRLFTIARRHPLVARVYLPEKDAARLRPGQPAEIGLEAVGGRSLTGRVTKISPVVDVASGTVKVTVETASHDPDARPGSYVRVAIITDVKSRALLVPKTAIVREDSTDYLYVANGNRAHRRHVSLGYASDGRIEVTSGLQPGEAVIVAGQGGLRDGARIAMVARRNEQQTAMINKQ